MLRRWLPRGLNVQLFGDRERFGQKAWDGDQDWARWQAVYPEAYFETQRSRGLFARVNDAGYEILDRYDLTGRRVAEIGPGGGYHLQHFRGRPASFAAVDVCPDFFPTVRERCQEIGLPVTFHPVQAYSPAIPLPSASVDYFLSFYSLEHLHPLEDWLEEIFRVLAPGGTLLGAIPTEGGLAWGVGRWLTSRRALRSRYGLDIRKIVCWEHPNFCDQILDRLSGRGRLEEWNWPLRGAPRDLSLVIRFAVQKSP
jgi:SAM-dependent methyltransferase